MKKVIVFMAVVILLISISTTDFSMAATKQTSIKSIWDKYGTEGFYYGMPTTRQPSIKIKLNNDETAKLYYGEETFDIKYMRYNNHILVGNGQDQDLLKLLIVARELSKQSYDLTLKNRILKDYSFDYDVIITEYQGPVQKCGIATLYNSSRFKITKLMEFYPGGVRTDGCPYMFNSSKDGMPHLLFIDENYQYYLPLRYIFEELGFTVDYEDNTVTISY